MRLPESVSQNFPSVLDVICLILLISCAVAGAKSVLWASERNSNRLWTSLRTCDTVFVLCALSSLLFVLKMRVFVSLPPFR